MRRRLAILVLALAAVLTPASARADNNGCPPGANCAIAVNQTDNSSLFDFAWAIKHVAGPVVDQGNAAVAYSSCNSCQTTAIAIEIVLVTGPTTEMKPENVAAAANAGCTLCDTFATAYQFVIAADGPVHFTAEGKQALHDIRKEIESWGKLGLSNEEIRSRLPAVIARLREVLATQLVRVGVDKSGDDDESARSGTTGNEPNGPPETNPTGTTETGGSQETTTLPAETTPGTDSGTTTTTPSATTTAPPPTTTTPATTTTTTP
ncbi:MAG TPA: hypothetical protein VFA56_10265 [Gaiellaceae bacterium]|nr:hypothetical protein [Gaiellaceae bacterium]